MKIRTNLILLSLISVIVIVIIGFIMFQTFIQVNVEVKESDRVNKIIKSISELNMVMYEYFMHHETRMQHQWELKYVSFGDLLFEIAGKKEGVRFPERLSILESITSDYKDLSGLFSQIQANFAKRKRVIRENRPQVEINLTFALEERLMAQTLMRAQKISSTAFKLSGMIKQNIARVQQRTNLIVLFSIIGFAIFSSFISFLIIRAITRPINELVKGAELIGKGNLDHRVELKTKNEIGELAVAFNQMTERRKLAEEEQRLQSEIAANMSEGVYLSRVSDGVILYTNPRFEEMLGYGPGEMVGKYVSIVNAPAEMTPEETVDHIVGIMKQTGVWQGEIQNIKKDGTSFWCYASASIFEHPEYGEIIVSVHNDIDERKRAEEVLQESEGRFRSTFEQAAVGIVHAAPDGRFLMINQRFCNIVGYTQEEMLTKTFPKITHPDDLNADLEQVQRLLENKVQTFSMEKRYIRKNGSHVWVNLTVSLVRKPSGEPKYFIGVIEDIENRKQVEEEKKKLEALLQQAQKMEAIGTLAGGIAHDFNNILFPIVGYAEMMLYDFPEDNPHRNNTNEILQGAKRAGDLVKQILTFSRQAAQELKPLMVQLIIKEVLKLIRSSLPTTIEIKQYISNNCGLVMADPTQIHQVAMNLMTNAFHAMEDEGGKLEVTLKEVELGLDDLTDPSMTPGAYVCLTVSDTGAGIDKALMDRIFDPYFTTKEKDKGTGLGLAVVHGIVKSYKGAIKVYSEPGEGTAFHVYLPVIKSQVETEESEAVTPVQKGTDRILLVDDEDPIVRMEKQMLERLGYDVTERTSSVEALEAFRDSPGKFDLVITDMTMPNMTGVQLSQKLLEIRPDIPIIICTGFSTKIDGEKATAVGIRGYVMKPVIMSEIAKKIREVLDE